MSAGDPDRPGLTSPGRRLWPGFTKADLHDYYEAVADRLLPALAGRPVTFRRHPAGVGAAGFFQKDLPEGAPSAVGRFPDWSESSQRTVTYALIESRAALAWCAQSSAVELHPWLARVDAPDRPDVLSFDLDPGPASVSAAVAAGWLHGTLESLGLDSHVKTSGKSGLHVLVPIERRYDFPVIRAVGLAVARCCAAEHADELTVEMRKEHRGDRLLLDWSRNMRGQTLVGAWSPRAVPEATVATPIAWEEVGDDLDPTAFTLATAPGRPDPWAAGPVRPQRLERVVRRLTEDGFPPVDASPRSNRSVAERMTEPRGT